MGFTTRVKSEASEKKPFNFALFWDKYGTFFILAIIVAIFGSLSPEYFLTTNNITQIFVQSSVTVLIGMGEFFAILVAGIDLSVGAILALSGMVTAKLMLAGVDPFLAAMIGGVLVGGALGAINGCLVNWTGLHPFIITLGTNAIFRGITLVISDANSVYGFSFDFVNFFAASVIGIPVPVIFSLIVALILWFLTTRMRLGRNIYALGGNKNSAFYSGIDVKFHILVVFIISGVCAGLAGVVSTARLGAAEPLAGMGFETYAIASAIIGGTSFFGGHDPLFGKHGRNLMKTDIRETDDAKGYRFAVDLPGFEKDEIHVDDYLWVNLGGRYTLFRVDGRDYHSLQPRLSARFRVRPDFSIKLAYDKMNQYVHRLSNTYVNQPTDIWVPVTDDIPPMSSHQVQLGFYYDFGRDYAFSMESFYKFMNNVIEYKDNWAPSADYRGWEERVGIGKGESYGFEWMARKKRGKTTGWISYTLSWTDRYYPDGSVNKGDRFPFRYDNRHKVNLLVTHKLSPKLELSAAWTFATGNRISVSEYRYLSPVVIKGDGAQFASIGYSAQWTGNIFNNVGLSERNNYRLAPYHRLDLNLNWYRSNRKGRQSIWSFGLYNAYASPNAFMTELEMYLGPDGKLSPRLKKTVLFFCVPSVSYTFKF